MIAILLAFFLFQLCASRWSLVFVFFFFLLVPLSLQFCGPCFGFVLVQSCICLIIFHLSSPVCSFWFLFSTDMVLPLDHACILSSSALPSSFICFLYSKTGATTVLYSLRFVLLEMFLEHQILFNLDNAALAVRVCFSGLLYHLSPYKCISQIKELIYFFYSLSSYKIISWFCALIVINFCLCHVDCESHMSGFDHQSSILAVSFRS